MSSEAILIGFDFGTTTSCAVIASATIGRNTATGRLEFRDFCPRLESQPVFTPFVGDFLDDQKLCGYLDVWLSGIDTSRVVGGGAVITGLAARQTNAAAFAGHVRRRLKDAVVAIAEDPRLESWLAFMGNCAELSRTQPARAFLNLDIGGGTTNIALGRDGEVLRTGSYFVGARHVVVAPGTYRIVRLSSWALRLLEHLEIRKGPGDELDAGEVQRIVAWYLNMLAEIVAGQFPRRDPLFLLHEQAAFSPPPHDQAFALTLSGGVGQLVYAHLEGQPWPATTAFGDLGIDLARGLAQDPFWLQRLRELRPTLGGRATVFGLLRYQTQLSGNTLHLDWPELLPRTDLMIVDSVRPGSSQQEIEELLALAAGTARGACLRVEFVRGDLAEIRGLATKIRQALAHRPLAPVPLVLLMHDNRGKILGQYLTNWSTSSDPVIVIDEIDARRAQFAHLGAMYEGIVPVSFYGAGWEGEA